MSIRKRLPAIGASAWLVAGLLSAAVVTPASAVPANRAPKTEIITMPDCPRDVDICLIGMGIHPTSNNTITGYVRVKTQHPPRAFEMFARFYSRVRGVWYEEATRTWKKDKLPPKGHTENLIPDLHTFCRTGPWLMSLHAIGISSDGLHSSLWYFYPAAKRANAKELHQVLASTVDLPQRKWPFVVIRHCT